MSPENTLTRSLPALTQSLQHSPSWFKDLPALRNVSHDLVESTGSDVVGRQQTSGFMPAEKVITNIGDLLYEAKHGDPSASDRPLAHAVRVTTASNAIRPELRVLERGFFKLLQSWQGTVIEVTSNEFIAEIRDKTNKTNPVEEVTLSIDEVSPTERDQIVPGAVFYWSIGYKDAPGEPRLRVSQIRFRRLPPWTEAELATVRHQLDHLKAFLFDDGG
jgi:hypothetical protein